MPPEIVPWVAVLAIMFGLLALLLEVFMPGFGVSGIIGIILLVWGVVLFNVDAEVTIKSLVIGLLISIAVFFLLFKWLSSMNFWQRLTLAKRQQNEDGYSASKNMTAYKEKEGIALTPLRPAGVVEIEGERLDVVSEGSFITPGAKIKVVHVDGMRVVVRAVEQ